MIAWEVTPQCDIECPYCYNVWNAPHAGYPEVPSTGELLAVAGVLVEARPASVTLTGGEPLLRDDLEELVRVLARAGLKVGVATNGRSLDDERALGLVQAGVRWFDIGLPAAGETAYSAITGSSGVASVKRGMIAVRKSGAALIVSQVLTRDSVRNTDDVVALACAMGADMVVLNRFAAGGRGLESAGDLAPGTRELMDVLTSASHRAREWGISVATGIPFEDCIFPHHRFPGISFGSCICGAGKWALGPDADLRVCEQSGDVLGSVLESPIREIWDRAGSEGFRDRDMSGDCSSCNSHPVCGGGCRFVRTARG